MFVCLIYSCLSLLRLIKPCQMLSQRVIRVLIKVSSSLVCVFPNLHTEVSRSYARPYSARLFSPSLTDYSNISYESSGLPSSLGGKSSLHSKFGGLQGLPVGCGYAGYTVCNPAAWSTLIRYYNLDIRTAPGSSILLS